MEEVTIEKLEELLNESDLGEASKLILYNDEVNTFDHVISCLQIYCDHSAVQAEQCALIVHNNGKCCVKKGSKFRMEMINAMLNLNKLNSEVE
jgi:ATP-dependent Clp protease adaptor protein ClpS